MKKNILAFIICFALLIPIASCTPANTDNTPINQSDYLFAIANNTVFKYNIESGICSPLCRDPLCKHNNDECPFFNIGEEIFQLNNTIIYYKDNKVLVYNLSTNETEEACSAAGKIYYPYLINQTLYFNTVAFDFSPNAEHTTTVDLFSYSFSNKELKHLNNEKLYDMQRIQGLDNNKIVWYDDGLQSLYTTNYLFEEKHPLNTDYFGIIAGSNSYRLRGTSSSRLCFDLYRVQDGNEITALHSIVSIKGYNGSLLATYNQEEGKYIGQAMNDDGSLNDIYEYQSNDIYIYDSYGKNGKKLCSIPDEYIIYSLGSTKITLSNGDYIGVQLKEYEFDSKGYVIGYKVSINLAIVNIRTGSCIISHYK